MVVVQPIELLSAAPLINTDLLIKEGWRLDCLFFQPSNIVLNPLEVDAKGVICPHYFSTDVNLVSVNCSFEGKGKKIWKIEWVKETTGQKQY